MIIDCDVHNDWGTAEVLLPYLDPPFRDYFERGELPGPNGALPHAHRPWFHPEDFRRADIKPETNDDHYTLMRDNLLDRYPIDIAILTGEEILEVSTLANPYYAQALARAYNDYLIAEWLPLDSRFKGTMFVAPQDPKGAAEEIRRIGSHPDIVQIFISSGLYRPIGDRFYHPIWEAAAEVDIPIAIHLGGQGGINYNPVGSGPVTYYWELHALLCQPAMTHMASTIVNGVFEKWPNAMLILVENGVAWVPSILWRLDSNYKALRKETPWLKRLPTEYFHDHIRVTTQPLEQPDNTDFLWSALEAMDAKNTLMFASDYPHWDFDDPFKLKLPQAWKENIMHGNARKVYRKLPQAPLVPEAMPEPVAA